MEFKTLRNIETSFRQIRLFTFVFAMLCFGVVGVVVFKSYQFAEAAASEDLCAGQWQIINGSAISGYVDKQTCRSKRACETIS
jgi:hypothetical protein